QGVDGPVRRHGAAGGDGRLPGHLAAEDALPPLLGAAAAEDVALDLLQIEQVQQSLPGILHGTQSSLSASAGGISRSRQRPHSPRTASPYVSSFLFPAPGIRARSSSDSGARSAIACSVASVNTT